ncbi:MAG TPA: hypothetical protein VKY74_17725 [Chloroflexia bacterium]|nr:hypothetical protein [Chloroflexia bacterium]
MDERERLIKVMAALEAQRLLLGDAAVAPAIAGLYHRLAELDGAPSAATAEGQAHKLAFLEGAGLILLAATQPELAYLFRHALIQDAAYSSLLKSDRAQLHQTTGEVIEQTYAGRTDELAGIIGHHFLAAGAQAKALHYLQRAGDLALQSFAGREAEAYFRACLRLAAEDRRRADLFLRIGQAVKAQDLFAEAIPLWRQAADLYAGQGDDNAVAAVYAEMVDSAWHAGQWSAAVAAGQEGLARTAGAPPSQERARLLQATARRALFGGDQATARALSDQAVAMARQLGDPATLALALTTSGIMRDQPVDQARATLEEALALVEPNSLPQSYLLNNLGTLLLESAGETELALSHYEKGLTIVRRMNSIWYQFFCLANVADAFLFGGRLDRVAAILPELRALEAATPERDWTQPRLAFVEGMWLRCCRELSPAAEKLRSGWQLAQAGNYHDLTGVLVLVLAETLLERGEVDQAGDLLARHLAQPERSVSLNPVWPHCLLSQACARAGNLDQAVYWLAAARQIPWGVDRLPPGQARLATAEATLAEVAGRLADALDWLQQAEHAWRYMGWRWYLARNLSEQGRLLAANGQRSQAGTCLQAAGDLFAQIGAPAYARAVAAMMESG